ncbi:MAG: hypothetical protein AB1760_01670 [Pseudomonadota bacterium]|jgi:hypothetical protein
MLAGLAEYLAREWAVVSQAPFTFIIASLLVGAVAWAAVLWRYGGKIDHLEERVRLRDDEIADYKRKLDGATPDEARARIEKLEHDIERLSEAVLPRKLDDKMRAELDRIGPDKPIKIAFNNSVSDARALASEARAYLAERYPHLLGGLVATITGNDAQGLIVREREDRWDVWVGHKPPSQ